MSTHDYIQNLIQHFQLKYSAAIFDRKREKYGQDKIANKMHFIKTYLLHSGHSLIAIDLEKDIDYLLVILCCLDLKIPFIPIRKEWPDVRKNQIKNLVGNCHFLNEEDLKKAYEGKHSENISSLKLANTSELAYIMFTSGTTGVPKGVMISRSALANFFSWIEAEITDVNSSDRLLNTTDFSFDVSFADVGLLLTKHVNFYMSDFSGDLFRMLGELDALQITVHCTTPNNYAVVLGEDFISRADLSALKLALVCGSRFSTKLLRMFLKNVPKCTVYNCYGPTENTVYSTYKNLTIDIEGSIDGDNVSIGIPFPGTGATIVNLGKEVDAGEEGELVLTGNQLMEGYIGNAYETEKRLKELNGMKCYWTGDIAFRNSNNDIFILGRKDDEIKVNGQRVNLNDIECYIMNIESVKSCALLPIPDDIRGTSLVLYVVLQRKMTPIEFRHQLETVLIKQQIPQEICIVDSLPVSDSGKISKKKLLEQYNQKLRIACES